MKRYNKLILFVHGLGGTEATWGKFDALIAADTDLAWDTAHFLYPSPSLGIRIIPFLQSTYQPIQVLADALRTVIEERYRDYEEIALVGHSLGGLVIRKYILTELQNHRDLRVQRVILYAVPNDGSSLAAVSRELSFGDNAHLKQLCKKSEFLESLRTDWARAEVSSEVDFTIVVGGDDRIVTLASAEGNFRSRDLEPKIIPDAGHINISKPKNADDLRYIILRNALKKKRSITQGRIIGSCLLSEWGKYKAASSLPFQLDEKRSIQLRSLVDHFGNARKTIRVIGLSGLGKSRLVYEAARSAQVWSPDILYYDAANQSTQLLDWLRKAVASGKTGTLIVDNCSVFLHGKLQEEVERTDSNICLITVDYSLETTGASTIRIERFKDEVIKAMLSPIYTGHIEEYELQKIVQFAQGFPQLAVMLADARLVDDGHLGNLNDDLIARKLLWGNDEPSPEVEKILQGCALFEHFGVDGEVREELKFIATSVISANEVDCYECIQRFAEKGLIDRRGRYAQLVPKPLAIRLAAQWWRRTQRERQIQLISNLPEVLESSFCAQIARLDFLPEVKDLTEDICGVQGPFGRAEVILSRKGSTLFRALVEVNPLATSSVIERILASLSVEDLEKIQGDTRRNLVWALEKLSIRRETFRSAAYSLLQLASAENETWSNNATGIFCQLFRVHLSGTAALPADKFGFIHHSLATGNERHASIVARALENAFDLNSGIRTVGAEYQGTGPAIAEWRPSLWQEIFDYLEESIRIILDIFDKFPALRPEVRQIIGKSIRTLVWNGRISALDTAILHIVGVSGHHWPQALESIKDCISYDQDHIPQEGKDALQRWAQLLGGASGSIEEKVKILVIDPPFEHRELENGEFSDIAQINAIQFAKELAADPNSIGYLIPLLLQPSAHRQTFAFAKALAENLNEPDPLIEKIIDELSQDHDRSDVLLRGLLYGIFLKSPIKWEGIVNHLEKSGKLDHIYPQIICTGDVTINRLAHAQRLAKNERTPLLNLRMFSYGDALHRIPVEDCARFAESILEINDTNAPWIALDLLFMSCYGQPDRKNLVLDSFANIIFSCNVHPTNNVRDMHQWSTVCGWLLENCPASALPLVEKLINIVLDKDTRMDIRESIGKILRKSIELYPSQAWPPLELAIINSSGIGRLNLLWLFEGTRRLSSDNAQSLMDCIPNSLLLEWCKKAPKIAPYFIARTISPFIVVDGSLKLNEFVAILLDNFEDNENGVGGAIASNMGTRSWSGSLVPLLERDKAALKPLLSHHSKAVSTWAMRLIASLDSEISREKVRDEEQDFK